ncbi:lipopolysaccharide assembly protein LapA domain-containing protein [Bartonella sp. B30(2025)]
MKIRRIFLAIMCIPLIFFLTVFVIANRKMVVLTFNPFQTNPESFTYQAPLFIWLFIFFGLGALLSNILNKYEYRKCKKALKKSKDELEKLKASLANMI